MTIKSIFKPFEYVQEKKLLFIGIGVAILSCILQTFTMSRGIAILKMATIMKAPTIFQTLADNIISTLLMAAALFAFGKFINSKTRFIDIVNVVLISRMIMYVIIFFDIDGKSSKMATFLIENANDQEALVEHLADLAPLFIMGIVSILALIVFAYYIYQGFKTATHMKKTGHIFFFILIILVTDMLTRFVTTLY